MREESWYKWFFVAMLVHALILVAFSVSIKRPPRKIDIPYYSVNLVGEIGEAGPEPKAALSAPPAPPANKAVEPSKPKPLPQPKEKERVVSTSKERSLPIRYTIMANPCSPWKLSGPPVRSSGWALRA